MNSESLDEQVNFFNPQGKSARTNVFLQQQQSEPIKVKLRRKRPTEDSQVRDSIQQSITQGQSLLDVTATGKIDFHRTTNFRDAFQSAAGGLSVKVNQQSSINYEQKIEASRDTSFIDSLIGGGPGHQRTQTNSFRAQPLAHGLLSPTGGAPSGGL